MECFAPGSIFFSADGILVTFPLRRLNRASGISTIVPSGMLPFAVLKDSVTRTFIITLPVNHPQLKLFLVALRGFYR